MSEMEHTEQDKLDITAVSAWGAILVFGCLVAIFLVSGLYERGKSARVEEQVVKRGYEETTTTERRGRDVLNADVQWADKDRKLVRLPIDVAKSLTLEKLEEN